LGCGSLVATAASSSRSALRSSSPPPSCRWTQATNSPCISGWTPCGLQLVCSLRGEVAVGCACWRGAAASSISCCWLQLQVAAATAAAAAAMAMAAAVGGSGGCDGHLRGARKQEFRASSGDMMTTRARARARDRPRRLQAATVPRALRAQAGARNASFKGGGASASCCVHVDRRERVKRLAGSLL
jgi:hypothetical protein